MKKQIVAFYKNHRVLAILVATVVISLGIFFGYAELRADQQKAAQVVLPDCTVSQNLKLCLHEYYSALVELQGAKQALASLRTAYDADQNVRADCHQLTHSIGRAAAQKYVTVSKAYAEGDQVCWSGYYHGVMESIITDIGVENVTTQIDTICNDISEDQRYSFYHYNCVHGLGHGTMLVTEYELFEALEVCNMISDSWEQTSCWGGAFMENIMADANEMHDTKYLRADDPLYPCTAVEERYKAECYKMQTSHALTVLGGDFSKVFEVCSGVAGSYRAQCYESLGRDASGRSISDAVQTRDTCMLGQDFEAQSHCILGAVRDFISYYHSDVQGKEFCSSLEPHLQQLCQNEVTSYYAAF
jgi:hypothetical protein